MHILITANSAWNIWNFRRPLLDALIADGHRLSVLVPWDESVGDLERVGCKVITLEMDAKGLSPLAGLRLLRRFKGAFREERPDVVLSFTIKNNIFGAMAARVTGIPFIPNVTGLGTAFLSGGLLQAVAVGLYRRAYRGLRVIFFQNKDDQALFLSRGLVSTEQAQLLPGSGIDLDRFAAVKMPPVEEPNTFLMIARLLRDKGVIEYVDAARQIKRSNPYVRFQLLGPSDSENRSAIDAATIKEWVDEGIVEYLGVTPDVRPHIAAANCVVLPSYREGAPRTLIEAAAMGRPVIATDVPGCRAVVDKDVSGFLCDVRSAESLAVAMQRFLVLPHEAHVAMGQAGRAKMEREFNQSIVVRAYQQAIATVTKAERRSKDMPASSPPSEPSFRHR